MFYLTGVDDDDFNFVKEPRCPIHPLPFFLSHHVFFLTFPFYFSISFFFFFFLLCHKGSR